MCDAQARRDSDAPVSALVDILSLCSQLAGRVLTLSSAEGASGEVQLAKYCAGSAPCEVPITASSLLSVLDAAMATTLHWLTVNEAVAGSCTVLYEGVERAVAAFAAAGPSSVAPLLSARFGDAAADVFRILLRTKDSYAVALRALRGLLLSCVGFCRSALVAAWAGAPLSADAVARLLRLSAHASFDPSTAALVGTAVAPSELSLSASAVVTAAANAAAVVESAVDKLFAEWSPMVDPLTLLIQLALLAEAVSALSVRLPPSDCCHACVRSRVRVCLLRGRRCH